jgi:hypothetical protein
MSEVLWGPEDLGRRYGVPIATVYAWRYRRTGPPGFKVGRHVRFRPEDVLAWEAEQVRSENGGRRR